MWQPFAKLWSAVRTRAGRRPPALLTVGAMGAWAGCACGMVEFDSARAFLPPRSSSGLLAASCAGFGMLIGVALAMPVRLLRAGLAAVWRLRGDGSALARLPALLVAAALFVGSAFLLTRWLQDAQLVARDLGAWLVALALACVMLIAFGIYAVALRLRPRLGAGLVGRAVTWSLPIAAWIGLSWAFWGDVAPTLDALPSGLLAPAGVLGMGVLVGVYGDRWLWRPAQWPLALAAIAVVAVTVPWSLASLGHAPTTAAALFGRTHIVSAAPRLLRAAGDRDGDGYASWLGGGDCDDGDPTMHPGALETLDDASDEDCDGEALRNDPTAKTLTGRLDGPPCESDFSLPPAAHVVLLVVDAARSDRLHGTYSRDVMPELRALSEGAVWFSRCYSPHPSTAYALPALFTGLQTRWARDLMASQDVRIPESRPLLQTELLSSGYLAAGIYGHFLAGHRHAMTRGMQVTRLRRETVNSSRVADDAIELIERVAASRQPLFLYAHFSDPHWEYEPYGPELAPWGNARHVDRYDGEVRNADRAIGRIVAALREQQLWQRTLLIVVADHGQEFGEHGGRFHGQSQYEEVVRVPCVMRVPGMKPRRIDQPVSLVDVFPTMLDLLGLDARPLVHGVSLEPIMLGQPCHRGPIVGEMQPWTKGPPFKPWLWYMVSGHEKIIYDVDSHTYQVFDLERDPGERRNLVEPEPQRFRRLRRQLHAEVTARIALPKGSWAAEQLEFGPLPLGTQR